MAGYLECVQDEAETRPGEAQYQREHTELKQWQLEGDDELKGVENQMPYIPGEWNKLNAAGSWTVCYQVLACSLWSLKSQTNVRSCWYTRLGSVFYLEQQVSWAVCSSSQKRLRKRTSLQAGCERARWKTEEAVVAPIPSNPVQLWGTVDGNSQVQTVEC